MFATATARYASLNKCNSVSVKDVMVATERGLGANCSPKEPVDSATSLKRLASLYLLIAVAPSVCFAFVRLGGLELRRRLDVS